MVKTPKGTPLELPGPKVAQEVAGAVVLWVFQVVFLSKV